MTANKKIRGTLHFFSYHPPLRYIPKSPPSHLCYEKKMNPEQKGFSFHINPRSEESQEVLEGEGEAREPKRCEILSTWPRTVGLGTQGCQLAQNIPSKR
jgi:hypothetical protein